MASPSEIAPDTTGYRRTGSDRSAGALTMELADLARELARPDRAWAILSEGNVSARLDDKFAFVKASGSQMSKATGEDMVQVDLEDLLALVDAPAADDYDVIRCFDAIAARTGGRRPSVESLLHAVCLDLPGVTVVGHTHPIPLNALLCSPGAGMLTAGSLFPDQVVVLGTSPLLVPYVDPGLRLAQVVRQTLANAMDNPRAIYLQNHGMFALGSSPSEVLQITEMAVKVAQIILGSLAAGGPRYLDPEDADRIDSRPDERLRRAALSRDAF